ncbi:MAG: hypothetical protein ABIS92_00930 [Polyangia bacterium]
MKAINAFRVGALLLMSGTMGCGDSKPANSNGGGVGHVGTGGQGGRPVGGRGGSGGGTAGTGGAAGAAGGAGGQMGPGEFTDFVKGLIQNKTTPNGLPETIDDKTFKDSMNPAAFDSLFP